MAPHDDLMASAVEQTGLDDFGDDSFQEGLEILIRSLRAEARLNATGGAVMYPRLSVISRSGSGGGLVPTPSRDRRRRDRGAALRARSAAHGFDGVVVPAGGGSEHPIPAAVGVVPTVPAAVDRRGSRSAHRAGCWRVGGHEGPCPRDAEGPMECLDLMALDFKTHLYLDVRACPVVRVVAARHRRHLHVPLRTSGAQALAMGRVARPWR